MSDIFNILDYTGGPLLKTGQITDLTPAGRTTKDDGGFQHGIAGSKEDGQYIILTTGQYIGTTIITVNSINDAHTNACVYDKVTGLMWNREVTPAIYGGGASDLLWDGTASSDEDIFEYCDQANLALLSGYSDWRVPNSYELVSLTIYDSTMATPRINSVAFPVWSLSGVHSSTSNASNAARSYQISFSNGGITNTTKTVDRLPTALCRRM